MSIGFWHIPPDSDPGLTGMTEKGQDLILGQPPRRHSKDTMHATKQIGNFTEMTSALSI